MPTVRTAAALSIALAACGCSGCHEDHPYVPYVIGSGAAGVDGAAPVPGATAAAAPSGSGAPPAFATEAARVAPAGLTQWTVDDLTLQAPEGRAFVSAVVSDFDGDGVKDAFAIARPEGGADAGELSFYRGGAGTLRATETFAPTPGLGGDAGCAPLFRLLRVGAHAVLAELGMTCAARAPGAPARWIAVIAAPPARPGRGGAGGVRFAATVADPPGAPTLSLDADTADRDGDGLPDVSLRVVLEGGGAPFEPGPKVSGALVWLDRPAGLSRDAAATEASFSALAQTAAIRARSAKEAPTVAALVAQGRALFRAVCAEGGSPRLLGVAGSGTIACGAARSLEELGLAEVRAYVTLADAFRAALALDRADRPPAAHTPARVNDALSWILPVAPVATARAVRAVAAVPSVDPGRPAWGPLAFEASGKLLVRTRAGVVRVEPDAGDETDADGVIPWALAVTSPDGALRWTDAFDACDGVALHATLSANGGDAKDVALPVAPPLGSRCGGPRWTPARAVPIAWGPGGLEALVEGEPVLVASDGSRATPLASFLDAPGPPGSPRASDGRTLVVPVSSGLLVRLGPRTRLLRAPDLDGTYGEQRGCAVSADATHVACVRAGKAWVGAWDAP